MTRLLVLMSSIAVALVVGGCEGSSGNNPPSEAETRRAISSALQQLQSGISTEDLEKAGTFVGELFVLQPQTAAVFGVGAFNGQGRDAFATFFERVIDSYGDIILTFELISLDIDSNIATAEVRVRFRGQRTDVTPPEQVDETFTAVMIFEFKNGVWQLINWGPSGHDEGSGGSL
jgi:hypothetical protein